MAHYAVLVQNGSYVAVVGYFHGRAGVRRAGVVLTGAYEQNAKRYCDKDKNDSAWNHVPPPAEAILRRSLVEHKE
jgi:hypothetical protein